MLNKQWTEEMELRTRKLARMEKGWNKRTGMETSSGEERENATFCEALRDGYVLCQLMNKWRPNIISRIDHREDGVTKSSNIVRFIVAAAEFGIPNDTLCTRDDFVKCTMESMGRVANTIIALSSFVDTLQFATKAIQRSHTHDNRSDKPFIVRQPKVPLPRPPSPPPRSSLRPAPAVSRASITSTSGATDTTSMYDGFSKAGSIRTNITEATSMVPSSGHPSLSRSEAKAAATELTVKPFSVRIPELDDVFLDAISSKGGNANKPGNGWKKPVEDRSMQVPLNTTSLSNAIVQGVSPAPSPHRRERRTSDLMRVTEENDDEGNANGGNSINSDATAARNESPSRSSAVAVVKWPDGFVHAFSPSAKYEYLVASPTGAPEEGEDVYIDFAETPRRNFTVRNGSTSPSTSSRPTDLSDKREVFSPTPRRPRTGQRISYSPVPSPSKFDSNRSAFDRVSGGPRPSSRGHLVPKVGLEESRFSFDNGDCSVPISPSTSSPAVPIPFPRPKSNTDPNRLQIFPPAPVGYPLTSIPGSRDGLDEESKGENSEPSSSRPLRRIGLRVRYQSDAGAAGSERATGVGLGRTLSSRANELNRGRRSRHESMMDFSSDFKEFKADMGPIRRLLIVKETGSPTVHFQLGNCIGRGQFGSVYRALNLNTGQTVAVKQIRLEGLSEDEVIQLMREVELLKRLSHPA
ncbi:uncharacterized protein EI90DRAFT_2386793 [Cantharellus anzutake]|uniref:uncharacterized protein n=1 Tax=Cantharellus anzutake TaxID=1750568 RepID=UPI001906923C|nr:uncharacterized protein EI90DRAFT_2386793 [Cantharellus anzutake]KAF8323512.1 hypothetical protein EI90DRAFT_2386793 [Cantharellus anzutake]